MITLSGTLSVKTITGRNGSFAVGKLVSPVGEFSVKDTILDQYPEGKYEGDFLISHIYPHTYIMRGSAVVEVRAKLEDIIISSSAEERQPDEPAVADPIEEQVASTGEAKHAEQFVVVAPEAESAKEAGEGEEMMFNSEQDRQDFELFGADLYGEVAMMVDVKLDPTVDRAKFRAQRDRLKELGYKFDAPTQAWVLP